MNTIVKYLKKCYYRDLLHFKLMTIYKVTALKVKTDLIMKYFCIEFDKKIFGRLLFI